MVWFVEGSVRRWHILNLARNKFGRKLSVGILVKRNDTPHLPWLYLPHNLRLIPNVITYFFGGTLHDVVWKLCLHLFDFIRFSDGYNAEISHALIDQLTYYFVQPLNFGRLFCRSEAKEIQIYLTFYLLCALNTFLEFVVKPGAAFPVLIDEKWDEIL